MVSTKLIPITLIFMTTMRYLYSIFFIDPMSGPDAISYLNARDDLVSHGLFSQISGVPFWPVGYPWFLRAIYVVFGPNLVWISLIQTSLWTLGLLSFYFFLSRRASGKVAITTTILLLFNPALTIASTELMYEIPQISLFLIGLDLLDRVPNSKTLIRATSLSVCGMLLWTFAAIMQPKILVLFAVCLIYFLFHQYSLKKSRIILVTFIVLALALTPSTLAARNVLAGDGVGVSQNLQTQIEVTLADFPGISSHYEECAHLKTKYDNPLYILCLQKIKFSKAPIEGIRLTAYNAFKLISPYVGSFHYSFGGTGTWYHGADIRRLLPNYEYKRPGTRFWHFDVLLSLIYLIAWLSIVTMGFKIGLLHFRREALFFGSLTLLLMAVSLLANGDSRYRLSVIPFYSVFLGEFLSSKYKRIFKD